MSRTANPTPINTPPALRRYAGPAMLDTLAYFSPHRNDTGARARGCLTCTHWQGRFFYDHVLCERDAARHVVGVATMGCAFWEREAGADDE